MVRMTDDPTLTLLVIQEKQRHDGFHIAFVPEGWDADQIDTALKELGIDAGLVCEVSDWKTTSNGLAVAWLPLPGVN